MDVDRPVFLATQNLSISDNPVSPDPPPRPSLKQYRSSPTLSPSVTQNQNPNPFVQKNNDPVLSLSFLSKSSSQKFLTSCTIPFQPLSILSSTSLLLHDSHVSNGDLSVPPVSVKLFFWNVRRLNDPDKHRTFVSWLHFHKPIFGAILETHVKELSLLPLMAKLCPGWSFVSNHLSDEDRRIILIWKHPLKVQVVNQSSQSITCILELPNSVPFFYTVVYASNQTADHSDLWTELLYLHDSLDLQNYSWIVGGDFNQILTPSEHSSPSVNA
ncbi:hypothetical protein DY000_02034784 [Brassica cretica]|uniref:Endonuclease/exonuclease/phosphatase domain-containing protein n=1 Tax=Brassica cretica TaxID=69181 RepID=A0ABQ7DEG8_BRACR|nr:hypothetical protein DY000_02034784 [Brassica cretica]